VWASEAHREPDQCERLLEIAQKGARAMCEPYAQGCDKHAGTLVKGAGAATAGWASGIFCGDDTKRKEL